MTYKAMLTESSGGTNVLKVNQNNKAPPNGGVNFYKKRRRIL